MRPFVFAFAVSLTAVAYAQTVPVPGDLVRAKTAEGTVIGTVAATRGDTLFVTTARPGSTVPIARVDMRSLEVRVRRSRGRGAVTGALVGAGVGGAVTLGYAAYTAGPESMGPGFALVIGPLIVIPATTAVGAAVGALLPGRRWSPAGRWEPVADVPVTIGIGGTGLSMRVRL